MRTGGRQRPAGERMGFWWRLAWVLLYYPSLLLARPRSGGVGVPAQGGAILVANHVSHVDPVILGRYLFTQGRLPRFMGKDTLFGMFFVGRALRGLGQIPVYRDSPNAHESFRAAVDALRAGQVVLVYPEGTVTRDPDWWPMSGKTGAARMALLVPEVPVIPVAQWGVQRNYDFYTKRIRPFPRAVHHIVAGEPIDLSAYRARDASPENISAMTDVIMKQLRRMVADIRGIPEPTGELYQHRGRAA